MYYLKDVLTLASDSWGSRRVSLLRFRLFTCSRTRLKSSPQQRHSLSSSELTTSCTVVVASYLKDFVCPFSRKTFRTLAMGGTQMSPRLKAEVCKVQIQIYKNIKKSISVYSPETGERH